MTRILSIILILDLFNIFEFWI